MSQGVALGIGVQRDASCVDDLEVGAATLGVCIVREGRCKGSGDEREEVKEAHDGIDRCCLIRRCNSVS